MKSRIARLGVLLAAVAGLVGTMAPPSSATDVKVMVFAGTVHVPGGLGYPGVGDGGGIDINKIPCTNNLLPDRSCVDIKTGPKGEPQVNFTPEGNHSGFFFISDVCAKVTVSVDPAKKTPGPQLCTISAAGAVWGYCGLSTGTGVVTVDDTTPLTVLGTKQSQSLGIKWTEVGGVLYITGGDTETNLYAVVHAGPVPSIPPVRPNCNLKRATDFYLTGVAVIKDCTPTRDIPVVCGP